MPKRGDLRSGRKAGSLKLLGVNSKRSSIGWMRQPVYVIWLISLVTILKGLATIVPAGTASVSTTVGGFASTGLKDRPVQRMSRLKSNI
jgi:hypothetical protein